MIRLILALTLLTMIGCAKAKVDGEVQMQEGALAKPGLVLVHDFAYSPEQVSPATAIGIRLYDLATGETLDEKEKALGDEVARELASEIVTGLQALGLNAQHASDAQLPDTGTVMEVEGQFVKIVEGNRLRRVVIGLGVGKSTLDTHVQVYDGGEDGRVLAENFATSSRGSLKPGVAEAALLGPVSAGVTTATGVALEYRQNAAANARRTGKLIVKHIGELAKQQGWVEK